MNLYDEITDQNHILQPSDLGIQEKNKLLKANIAVTSAYCSQFDNTKEKTNGKDEMITLKQCWWVLQLFVHSQLGLHCVV